MKSKSLTASLMLGALMALPFHGEAKQTRQSGQIQETTKGYVVKERKGQIAPQGSQHFQGTQAVPSQRRHLAPVAESAKNAERAIPFHGTITSVDKSGQSFTVESKSGASRTLNVTERTALSEHGNSVGFHAVSKGEMVRGSYWKLPNGSLEAKTVKVGELTPAEKEAAKEQIKATRSAKKAALH